MPFGTTASITFERISLRSFSVVTVSACWVDTTMASMRTGTPSSYSTDTCVLPSGRRYFSSPLRRASLKRRAN